MHNDVRKIIVFVAVGVAVLAVLFWLSCFVQVYERGDMTIGDKILWTFILIVPIFGIILYYGLAPHWKKRHSVIP